MGRHHVIGPLDRSLDPCDGTSTWGIPHNKAIPSKIPHISRRFLQCSGRAVLNLFSAKPQLHHLWRLHITDMPSPQKVQGIGVVWPDSPRRDSRQGGNDGESSFLEKIFLEGTDLAVYRVRR